MDENTTLDNQNQKPEGQNASERSKKVLIAVLIALLLIAIAAGIYVWQHQKVKIRDLQGNVTSLSTKVDSLNKQITATATTDTSKKDTTSPVQTAPATVSSDDQVIAVVKNYCNANVDPDTKKPLVVNIGKAGADQKKVLYSADKNFAYVNAICSKDGTTENSGSAYYLKKVNDTWVFLYRGQMANPDYTAQFNIPRDFN